MLGKIHLLFYVPFKDAPNLIYYIRVCSSKQYSIYVWEIVLAF